MKLLKSIIVAALALAIALQCEGLDESDQDLKRIEWYKKSTYYHIYLRSFQDSDGDGQGDLRGVIQRLDYLKQLGVGTILMAPFYSSPMKDGGYDISDYKAINPVFGTLNDFDQLIDGLNQRGMRMVVDFVPNHSSNLHPWFQCSERALIEPERCGKYKDYYVWVNSTRYEGKYPSNWISVFGGTPAWTWSDIRKEFYLHQFLPEQPDLNFTNPIVREEFKEIARFWFRRGAAGLRVDSAIYMIEDYNYPDEPPNPNWKQGDDPADRLSHIYTRALYESVDIVKDLQRVINEPEFKDWELVVITEAYDKIPKLIEYYGPNPNDRVAELPFNFQLLTEIKERNFKPKELIRAAMGWIQPTLDLGWPNEHGAMSPWIDWVTGNHDNSRMVNRVGRNNADAYTWLSFILPGVPVNYYGDELFLHDLNYNRIPQKTIDEGESSRLPERGPIAWTDTEPSGGFSNTSDIWLPLNTDYKTNNVQSLLASKEDNHLKRFIALNRIHREHLGVFVFGDLVFYDSTNENVLALGRTTEKYGNLLMLVSCDPSERVSVKLHPSKSVYAKQLQTPPKRGLVLLSSSSASPLQVGTEIELESASGITLEPSQAILIKF